jgi:hypothetical protein
MTHNIFLTRGDIYLHQRSNKKKSGGSLTQTNDTIRKMTSQINNPSTGIAGLGTQNNVLAKSAFKPAGTNIIFGGSLNDQLSKLNFNTNKSNKDRNIKLRL